MSTADLEKLDLDVVWRSDPPLIDFVLPGLAAGTVGMLVAAGGTGKTYAMLATALGIAVGRDVGGIWGSDLAPGPAVFLSLEDPDVVLRSRLHALRGLIREDEIGAACERLHVLSCAGRGLSFALKADAEPEPTEWFRNFGDHLKAIGPRLCVVDTLNRSLGGISENDAGAMGWIIGQIELLAREAGCAIVLCHHVSKQALTLSSTGEAHAARGSSVITDNARWQCNLSMLGDKDPRSRGRTEVERRSLVQLAFSKMNYGPPVGSRWLHRDGNGVLRHHGELADPRPRARPRLRKPAVDVDGGSGGAASITARTRKGTQGGGPGAVGMRRPIAGLAELDVA